MDFEKIWFCMNNSFFNFHTGEIANSPYELPKMVTIIYPSNCPQGKFEGWYIDTDEDNHLVLTAYGMDISKPKRGERIRKWSTLGYYVYDKNHQIIPELSTRAVRDNLLYNQIINNNSAKEDYYVNAVKKVFGSEYFFHGENNFYKIDSSSMLFFFLDSKELKKKDGKKQRIIDELSALTPPAEEIPVLESYDVNNNMWYSKQGFAIITAIKGYKEPCCAIRTFILDTNGEHFYEGSRIYVTKKDFVIAKRRNIGDYVTAGAQQLSYWKFPMADIEKDSCKGTMLEYFECIASEFIPEYRTALLFMMCKHPIIEKLYKAGYKNLAACTVRQAWTSDKAVIKEVFGTVDEKEKNLYKAVGANAYQLGKINEYAFEMAEGLFMKDFEKVMLHGGMVLNEYTKRTILSVAKACMETDNLSSLDNESFDMLMELVINYNTSTYRPQLVELLELYSLSTILKHKETILGILHNEGVFKGPRYSSLWLFRDLIHTLKLMDMKVPLNFKNHDEVLAAHDQMAVLYNSKHDIICMEKFEKASKKLMKYEYEGKDYCIVAPRRPDELALEGIMLHHCVKSYIDKVADEFTGIVFIREKTDTARPFYTVEVQKDVVQQVHGMCNCNVEKDSPLEDFINEWVSAKKLSMANINKVR